MQQTEKYKLNLIEPTDPFLPDGLNQNTQKIEEVLQTHMEGPVAELEQRVTVLEGRKIVFGTYLSTGATMTISLGFTPLAVYAHIRNDLYATSFVLQGQDDRYMKIVEGGFQVKYLNGNTSLNMGGGATYNYIAFG